MKLVTFNNIIPSYLLKLIQWRDVEESDEEVEPEQYSEEDDVPEDDVPEDDEHLGSDALLGDKNPLFNSSEMQYQRLYSLVSLPKKTGMLAHILDSPWDKRQKHLLIMFLVELSGLTHLEEISHKPLTLMEQPINILEQESQL